MLERELDASSSTARRKSTYTLSSPGELRAARRPAGLDQLALLQPVAADVSAATAELVIATAEALLTSVGVSSVDAVAAMVARLQTTKAHGKRSHSGCRAGAKQRTITCYERLEP